MKELVDYSQNVKPVIAVFPQCPAAGNAKWVDLDWAQHGHVQPPMTDRVRMVFEILDDLNKTLPVDKDRVYVCGLSMGGYGTWDVLCRDPNRFAAGLICCGGGDAKVAAAKLKDKPLWIVHGDHDGAVPHTNAVEIVAALKAAGSKSFTYTQLPGYGHNVWGWTFGNKEILNWLFSQKIVQRDF